MLQIYKDNRPFSPVVRTIHVGMDSRLASYSYAKQNDSNWCWAACIEMITKYYGIHVKQEFFAKNHCGIDEYGRIKNCPAAVDVITNNLNWCLKTHCITTHTFNGRPSEKTLIEFLNANVPIIIAYKHSGPIGHAVLLTGMIYEEDIFGTELKSLIVRDPARTDENIRVSGRRIHTKHLLDSIYAWWIPTVTKHYPPIFA